MIKDCGIYTLIDQETLDKDMCVNNIRIVLAEN